MLMDLLISYLMDLDQVIALMVLLALRQILALTALIIFGVQENHSLPL